MFKSSAVFRFLPFILVALMKSDVRTCLGNKSVRYDVGDIGGACVTGGLITDADELELMSMKGCILISFNVNNIIIIQ